MTTGVMLVGGGIPNLSISNLSQPAWVDSGGNRTYTNSDFTAETTTNGENNFVGLTGVSSGFVLVEYRADTDWTANGESAVIGFCTSSTALSLFPGQSGSSGIGWAPVLQLLFNDYSATTDTSVLPTVSSIVTGDIMQMILDMDNGAVYCGFNGDWGTAWPVVGQRPAFSGFSTATTLYRHARTFYTGDQITITNPIEQTTFAFDTPTNTVTTGWGN